MIVNSDNTSAWCYAEQCKKELKTSCVMDACKCPCHGTQNSSFKRQNSVSNKPNPTEVSHD